MRKFNVAIVQLDTQNNKKENLDIIAKFIEEAVMKNAKIVSFPEVMNLVGKMLVKVEGQSLYQDIHLTFFVNKLRNMEFISMVVALLKRYLEIRDSTTQLL